MYLLTLLAFFSHQIFELTDGLYQAARKKRGSKVFFWAADGWVSRVVSSRVALHNALHCCTRHRRDENGGEPGRLPLK